MKGTTYHDISSPRGLYNMAICMGGPPMGGGGAFIVAYDNPL